MANDTKDGGVVSSLAAGRIRRRYADGDATRLRAYLAARVASEAMVASDVIDQLIEAIRRAEERGVTRYQLSQETGIPQSTLSRLMRRERESLKVETVEKLCRQLGMRLVMVRTKKPVRKLKESGE